MKKNEDFASNEAPTTGSIPSTATKPRTATLLAALGLCPQASCSGAWNPC
jgi:hypothetical protein